jgi:hypothetical protein
MVSPAAPGASGATRDVPSTKVVTDWTALIPGDFVTVLESNTLPHSGWIDAVTDDGRIIWLVLAFGRGRRMFFRENGDIITVEVSQAQPASTATAWCGRSSRSGARMGYTGR